MNDQEFGRLRSLLRTLSKVALDDDSLTLEPRTVVPLIRDHFGGRLPSRHESYYTLYKRYAEPPYDKIKYSSFEDLTEEMLAGLRSDEFNQRFLELLTREFDHVPRTIFLHIPKTGGTYVRETLQMQPNSILWDRSYERVPGTARERALSGLLRLNSGRANRIYISGHYSMDELAQRQVFTPFGRAFTVIRHPVSMIVSAINYIIDCLLKDPTNPSNSHWWIRALRESGISITENDSAARQAFGRYLLRAVEFQDDYRCPITRNLSSRGMEGAFEACDAFRVEFVLPEAIDRYLTEELDVSIFPDDRRINESEKTFRTICDFSLNDRAYIFEHLCAGDLAFFEHIANLIGAGGSGWACVS